MMESLLINERFLRWYIREILEKKTTSDPILYSAAKDLFDRIQENASKLESAETPFSRVIQPLSGKDIFFSSLPGKTHVRDFALLQYNVSEAASKISGAAVETPENEILINFPGDVKFERYANEDAAFRKTLPNGIEIAGVIDGVGGGSRGDFASRLISRIFQEQLVNLTPDMTDRQIIRELEKAAHAAGAALNDELELNHTLLKNLTAEITEHQQALIDRTFDGEEAAYFAELQSLEVLKDFLGAVGGMGESSESASGASFVLTVIFPQKDSQDIYVMQGGDPHAELLSPDKKFIPLTFNSLQPRSYESRRIVTLEQLKRAYLPVNGGSAISNGFFTGDDNLISKPGRYKPVYAVVKGIPANYKLILKSDGVHKTLDRSQIADRLTAASDQTLEIPKITAEAQSKTNDDATLLVVSRSELRMQMEPWLDDEQKADAVAKLYDFIEANAFDIRNTLLREEREHAQKAISAGDYVTAAEIYLHLPNFSQIEDVFVDLMKDQKSHKLPTVPRKELNMDEFQETVRERINKPYYAYELGKGSVPGAKKFDDVIAPLRGIRDVRFNNIPLVQTVNPQIVIIQVDTTQRDFTAVSNAMERLLGNLIYLYPGYEGALRTPRPFSDGSDIRMVMIELTRKNGRSELRENKNLNVGEAKELVRVLNPYRTELSRSEMRFVNPAPDLITEEQYRVLRAEAEKYVPAGIFGWKAKARELIVNEIVKSASRGLGRDVSFDFRLDHIKSVRISGPNLIFSFPIMLSAAFQNARSLVLREANAGRSPGRLLTAWWYTVSVFGTIFSVLTESSVLHKGDRAYGFPSYVFLDSRDPLPFMAAGLAHELGHVRKVVSPRAYDYVSQAETQRVQPGYDLQRDNLFIYRVRLFRFISALGGIVAIGLLSKFIAGTALFPLALIGISALIISALRMAFRDVSSPHNAYVGLKKFQEFQKEWVPRFSAGTALPEPKTPENRWMDAGNAIEEEYDDLWKTAAVALGVSKNIQDAYDILRLNLTASKTLADKLLLQDRSSAFDLAKAVSKVLQRASGKPQITYTAVSAREALSIRQKIGAGLEKLERVLGLRDKAALAVEDVFGVRYGDRESSSYLQVAALDKEKIELAYYEEASKSAVLITVPLKMLTKGRKVGFGGMGDDAIFIGGRPFGYLNAEGGVVSLIVSSAYTEVVHHSSRSEMRLAKPANKTAAVENGPQYQAAPAELTEEFKALALELYPGEKMAGGKKAELQLTVKKIAAREITLDQLEDVLMRAMEQILRDTASENNFRRDVLVHQAAGPIRDLLFNFFRSKMKEALSGKNNSKIILGLNLSDKSSRASQDYAEILAGYFSGDIERLFLQGGLAPEFLGKIKDSGVLITSINKMEKAGKNVLQNQSQLPVVEDAEELSAKKTGFLFPVGIRSVGDANPEAAVLARFSQVLYAILSAAFVHNKQDSQRLREDFLKALSVQKQYSDHAQAILEFDSNGNPVINARALQEFMTLYQSQKLTSLSA